MPVSRAESLKSPLLSAAGFRHAFFTRRGGVSRAPFESLNFSVSVGDEPEAVEANLARAAEALDVEPDRICFLSQVHGTQARFATGATRLKDVLFRQGDAILSQSSEIACGVRSADCVPILIADRESGAVAAAHAGWRGVVRGVVASTVTALRNTIRKDGTLLAAIGPHISLAAFEVSSEVADQLAGSSPAIGVVDTSRARPHVDLRRIVRAQLESMGLLPDHIDDVLGCTLSEPERFFSYRRDGQRSGRHLSAIVARP